MANSAGLVIINIAAGAPFAPLPIAALIASSSNGVVPSAFSGRAKVRHLRPVQRRSSIAFRIST
jgi:hypothetical protein